MCVCVFVCSVCVLGCQRCSFVSAVIRVTTSCLAYAGWCLKVTSVTAH